MHVINESLFFLTSQVAARSSIAVVERGRIGLEVTK